ncbi:X-linked interleukin-1 receptor accessory -like 2 [Labeo rohita]|uniref:X-linked interleukin-1 receptor accessory-like 2 n=1 Tax=Labeo rohita TaxID=84645 RepID=A0A498LK94_LABRO|nr:X-linked interleukin-1 receptor accessory -like 2 [Labeo rohita]
MPPDLMDEVKQLKNLVKEKGKKIKGLERRINELEQYTRMEGLIISGLETKHQTYASTVAGGKEGEDAPPEELQTLEKQVIKFFENIKKYVLKMEETQCQESSNIVTQKLQWLMAEKEKEHWSAEGETI